MKPVDISIFRYIGISESIITNIINLKIKVS